MDVLLWFFFFLDVVVLVLDVLSQGSALFEELLSLAFSR